MILHIAVNYGKNRWCGLVDLVDFVYVCQNSRSPHHDTLFTMIHAQCLTTSLCLRKIYFCVSQVGRFEVNLISPDSKTVVLEKNFKDISSCCQVGLFSLAVFTLKTSLRCLCCRP